MNTYVESKKTLDKIASKYSCKGDIIMRTAAQYIIEYGQYMFKDEDFIKDQIQQIEDKHRISEEEGKHLWVTKDFELAIFNCARELAEVNSYDLIVYMQKEMYWSNEGGLDYKRAIHLLEECMDWIDVYGTGEGYSFKEALDDLGFDEDEIEELGFEYALSGEEEEDNE